MKVFISSDIEGTNGICAWEETNREKSAYAEFARKMTEEVRAVCEGINKAAPGAEILVKDAHDSARNIDHSVLPENVSLNRGWSASPLSMMFGIDNTFDASMMTGYHSAAGRNGNPLAHTMNPAIAYLKINDRIASEFLLSYYISLYFGVPVVLVSGDAQLCETVREIDANIVALPAFSGKDNATTSPHPSVFLRDLSEMAEKALARRDNMSLDMPKFFSTEVYYKKHAAAARAAYYPGAKLLSEHIVGYDTEDYMDFLTYFMFTHE